jgi:GT2 family glycosyltransferase
MNLAPHSALLGWPVLGTWDRRSEREVDVISGMFMLFTRSTLERVGLLDERFFIYAEEADFCYRVAQAGLKRVFTPCGQIIHLDGGSKSTSQVSVRMYVQLQKSLLQYIQKHHSPPAYWLTKFAILFCQAAKAAAWKLQSLVSPRSDGAAKTHRAVAAVKFLLSGNFPR